ncbi:MULTISPECIES: carbohydrate ABC transporter permease [Arthrobacter]|uniref:Sugar ABC transporter permease n=1 Tax=Arthrobacter oryzae TaxID=409290 RepID=A0A3N0BVZ5_9MICC|nr:MULTISPECIES: sugar ABC transporter permease [Arthrobacter]QYF90012.1 sugar ABC transporter permease [Arthrobacter sp. PAMC25284]RNL53873.1 sugar ABC transporter permease [Arthrobacter oryzae]
MRPAHRLASLQRTTRVLPLAPAAMLLLVFLAGPLYWSFQASLTNVALTGRNARSPEWVGLANYERLAADPLFPLSVGLTVVFVLASAVIGQNLLGLAIAALMLKARKPVAALVGTAVVAAWMLPEIVAAFAAYAYFSPEGTLNQLLAGVGIRGADWLFSYPLAAIILANVWRGTAFSMLVYRAALADVPAELIEAAALDGAGDWQRGLYITLPLIRRSVATNLMLTTLQTLAVFTLIWVMTGGGPSNATATLPVLAYQQAFRFGDIGYGTAIASVLILIGLVFGMGYARMLQEKVR